MSNLQIFKHAEFGAVRTVEIDGEPLGHTPLEFSILHRAIRIVVARDFYQRCAAVGAETPAG